MGRNCIFHTSHTKKIYITIICLTCVLHYRLCSSVRALTNFLKFFSFAKWLRRMYLSKALLFHRPQRFMNFSLAGKVAKTLGRADLNDLHVYKCASIPKCGLKNLNIILFNSGHVRNLPFSKAKTGSAVL